MWTEVNRSSWTRRSRDQDGVFEVAALPREEGAQDVLAEGQLAVGRRRRIGDDVAAADALALDDRRALVDAGALVGAVVLAQSVVAALAPGADDDLAAGDRLDFPVDVGQDHLAGVDGRLALHPGRHEGHFRADQRHGLGLHVGAHQGPVGVVVLQEGDQGGADADDLPRGDVHVVDLIRLGEEEVAVVAARGAGPHELVLLIERSVGLGDDELSSSSAVR